MTEAQKCLYHIAENMRMDKSISKEGYEYFQQAIKALEQQNPMENFESVKDHILKLASDYKCWDNRLTHEEALELCHILEQESCEDCISRQAYIERFRKWAYSEYGRKIDNEALAIRVAMSLPSVTPQPKTGHWIESDYGNMISQHRWYCSECGGMHHDTKTGEWREVFDSRYAYCPLCGARMIGLQERSDKE